MCDLVCYFYAKKGEILTKDWISVKDLASIKGVTERAVRKAVNQNKYVTRMVDGTTGAKYEILVESLDYNLQNVINFENKRLYFICTRSFNPYKQSL